MRTITAVGGAQSQVSEEKYFNENKTKYIGSVLKRDLQETQDRRESLRQTLKRPEPALDKMSLKGQTD